MSETGSAAPFVPERLSLTSLREAAAGCRGCELWKTGTQTVFGEGRARSRLLLVGEQPGDKEDQAGRRSSGPPAACSTSRSRRRGSTARTST